MKSYFTFLSRNKLYAAIEVLGLALAFGFIIILASYARTEFSVGAKQPLSQKLYAIGTEDSFGMTLGTAEEFFPSIPEIKSWTRVADYGKMDITIGEEYYPVEACAVDTNFLQLFDYRLTGCDKDRILPSVDQAIISESFAKKAFAGEDPIGRTITKKDKNYTITGIIEDFGASDVLNYSDLFLCMDVMNDMVRKMDQFGSVHTFLTLADGTNPDDIAAKLLDKYCAYWDWYERDASKGDFLYGCSLTRLDNIYFSGKVSYDVIRVGDKKTVEILLVVALVLLVSAIFNYINLTVAQAGKRAKEMATRRLMGESQVGIIRRYIFESFLFTLGCFVLGCILAFCLKPMMDELLSTDIPLYFDWTSVVFAIVLICIISLISGLLPAMISSRFKPIDVVKGTFRLQSKMVFSRVFIVCQNVLSTVLIAVALTMTLQMRYLVNMPCGYNTADLIELKSGALGFRNVDAQNELVKRLKAIPCVEEVGKYLNTPFHCSNNGLQIGEEKMSWLSVSSLDTVSFKLLGFKVIEQFSAPLDRMCWFSEDAKKRFEITEQNNTLGSMREGVPEFQCCGIIADYMSKDALATPMEDSHSIVMIRNDFNFGMLVKVVGDRREAFAAVGDVWREMAKEYLGVPKEPDMIYMEDQFSESLSGKRNTMMLVCIFMMLSILISALGLFAMSVYFSDQQKKAIALHKVFGAETGQAVVKLSRPFIVTSLIAIVIATPISIKLMDYYLEGFYNRIAFPWWVLFAAALISLAISTLCVLGQTIKTARANPVKSIVAE